MLIFPLWDYTALYVYTVGWGLRAPHNSATQRKRAARCRNSVFTCAQSTHKRVKTRYSTRSQARCYAAIHTHKKRSKTRLNKYKQTLILHTP